MTNSNTFSVNRLDELMNTIKNARTSLNEWQDKRTQALISLDAFTYDIKMIEEEKNRSEAALQEVKNELKSQVRVYQSHINELTDEVQLLKLENENLKNEGLAKDLVIENQLKEIENQKLIHEQWVNQQEERDQAIRADVEAKFSHEAWELQLKNDALNAHLLEANERRIDYKNRCDRLELEIMQIRTQMINALKPGGHHSNLSTSLSGDGGDSGAVSESSGYMNASRVATSGSSTEKKSNSKDSTRISMEEVKRLRPVAAESESVDEYLKRMGY